MTSPYFLLWRKANGQDMDSAERMAVYSTAQRRGVVNNGNANEYVAASFRSMIDDMKDREALFVNKAERDRIRVEREHYEKNLAEFEKATGIVTENTNVTPAA